MKRLWKQVRYRLEYFACRLLAALIPLLPRRASLQLAAVLGALYYRFDAKSRAVALENLRLALGETLDPVEREKIARASFLNFARAMIDLFWGKNLTPENFRHFIRCEGFDTVRALQTKHGRFICVAIHFGSQEWAPLGCAFEGLKLSLVALDFKNPSLEGVFRRAREQAGSRIIGQQQSMLKLLRAILRGGGTGLLVDLALKLDQPGVVIDGFGMKMHVTFLHALLHARTGLPIVPFTAIPHPDGTCTLTAHPALEIAPGASHQQVAQQCWDFFEPIIRARPDLWLWNYKHWRYRPSDAGREYPFYANVSKKFDKIVAASAAIP